MKHLRLLVLSLVMVTAFVSCKKDKETEPTKNDLLTAKIWKYQSITINPALTDSAGTIAITDLLNDYYAPCVGDNTEKYNKDKTYSFEEGSIQCTSGTQVNETGTWSFSTDEKVLVLSVAGAAPQNNTLLKLDATTLQYTYTIPGRSTIYTITTTLTNQ